jgi:hypothetical protein
MSARSRIRTLTTTAITAGALGIAALATAATAAAGPMAEGFLADLESHGITYPDARLAEVDGQLVCSKVWQGQKPADIAVEVYQQTDLTAKQAAYFVAASIDTYCPASA